MVSSAIHPRCIAQRAIRWNTTSHVRKQSSKHGTGSSNTRASGPSTQSWANLFGLCPVIRQTTRVLGFILGVHIFIEYFYSIGPSYGISMLPTLYSTGDWLIMSKIYRKGRGIKIGDLVSFKHPLSEDTRAVKRVIGMPGDFVLRDTPGTSDLMIQVSQRARYCSSTVADAEIGA